MRPLGYSIEETTRLSESALHDAILERRTAIRSHRDQRGDDRCWLDDAVMWSALVDTPSEPTVLPGYDEMMRRCTSFYNKRRSDISDPVPKDAIIDREHWDDDLASMTHAELLDELLRIQKALRTHRDINGRERNTEDDRALYRILPEHLPADFRLPAVDAFLGTAKPCAGCPNFWKSHEHCGTNIHNTHRWGPCGGEIVFN